MRSAYNYEYIDGDLVRSSVVAANERDVRKTLNSVGGDLDHPHMVAVTTAFVEYDPKSAVIHEWVMKSRPESMFETYPWLDYYNGTPGAETPPEYSESLRQAQIDAIVAEYQREVFKAQRHRAISTLTVDVGGKVFDADETSQTRLARVLVLAEALTTDTVVAYLDSIYDNANTMTLQELVSGLRDAMREVRDAQTATWVLADNTATSVTVDEIKQALHGGLLSQESQWVEPS